MNEGVFEVIWAAIKYSAWAGIEVNDAAAVARDVMHELTEAGYTIEDRGTK